VRWVCCKKFGLKGLDTWVACWLPITLLLWQRNLKLGWGGGLGRCLSEDWVGLWATYSMRRGDRFWVLVKNLKVQYKSCWAARMVSMDTFTRLWTEIKRGPKEWATSPCNGRRSSRTWLHTSTRYWRERFTDSVERRLMQAQRKLEKFLSVEAIIPEKVEHYPLQVPLLAVGGGRHTKCGPFLAKCPWCTGTLRRGASCALPSWSNTTGSTPKP
jgi:hypothetical protein